MHADGLTKLSATLRPGLLDWLQYPTAQLIDGNRGKAKSAKIDGERKIEQ